ncbi:MAG: nucleotidyl transferase AbiEii/AbiGii toxin family protein [Nitrososphaerota archaeon]|jgi:predicted nucleotidyltransferase component of viral defense system|nr:nucleotidyl transferase AbiEii/AbiGii toxin family protein [Nitrososphaerota archaeon]MDG6936507.1 nucleotidyl transferase AbiEii/AbiGii toxin family protein [Nitrososphaerota archaeon]MDG6944982.1 nucleotidyl transferase AbiEii/AbiGii toxin family protein [Nitrososphaerota archaeon]
MIDEYTLLSFLPMFTDERQLEKDYLLNLTLKSISLSKLSTMLEFKGGTALYMLHGLDRFSEDLDFSYIGGQPIEDRIDELMKQALTVIDLSYRVSKSKGNVLVREGGRLVGIRSEFFVEGPLYSKNRVRHKIKIDISARNDTIKKPEVGRMVSKYYDVGSMIILTMPAGEMLAEKLCSIIERKEPRDLYDAYFLIKNGIARFDRKLFETKLELRNIDAGIDELKSSIEKIDERNWKGSLLHSVKLLAPVEHVRGYVLDNLQQ